MNVWVNLAMLVTIAPLCWYASVWIDKWAHRQDVLHGTHLRMGAGPLNG